MNSIHPLVSHLCVSDGRSALYYLSRYLKQAEQFERYGKDIFVDEERSSPSDEVRKATLSIIRFIEEAEGISAAKFDELTYKKWTDHVAEVEAKLDPVASAAEVERARKFVEDMELPPVRSR
ncbi:MAG: hypothetical protein ACREBU_12630 [Nitrososphaera sp.]